MPEKLESFFRKAKQVFEPKSDTELRESLLEKFKQHAKKDWAINKMTEDEISVDEWVEREVEVEFQRATNITKTINKKREEGEKK